MTSRESKIRKQPFGSVKVQFDVRIENAEIQNALLPNDAKLCATFKRDKKKLTTEPAEWVNDAASWNQIVGLSTSVAKKADGTFEEKIYNFLLTGIPSQTTIALFELNISDLIGQPDREAKLTLEPIKSQDDNARLSITVRFDIVDRASSNLRATRTISVLRSGRQSVAKRLQAQRSTSSGDPYEGKTASQLATQLTIKEQKIQKIESQLKHFQDQNKALKEKEKDLKLMSELNLKLRQELTNYQFKDEGGDEKMSEEELQRLLEINMELETKLRLQLGLDSSLDEDSATLEKLKQANRVLVGKITSGKEAQAKVVELEASKAELLLKVSELEQDPVSLSDLHAEMSQCQDENELLKAQVLELQQDKDGNELLKAQVLELQQVKDENELLKAQVLELQDEKEKWTELQQQSGLQVELDAIQISYTELEALHDDIRRENETQASEISSLKEDLEKAHESKQYLLKELEDKPSATAVDELQRTVNERDEEIEDLKTQLNVSVALSEGKNQATMRVDELNDEIHRLKDKLSRMDEISTECEKLTRPLEELKRIEPEKDQDFIKLKQENLELKQQAKDVTEKLETITNEKKALKVEMDQLQAAQTASEQEEEESEEIEKLNDEIDTLTSTIEDLESKLDEANDEIDDLQDELDAATGPSDELQKKIQELEEKLEESSTDELKERITKLSAENHQLLSKQKTAERELKTLKDKTGGAQGETVKTTPADSVQLQVQLEQLQEELEETRAEKNRLLSVDDRLQQVTKQGEQHSAQVQVLLHKLDELVSEKSQFEAMLEDMRKVMEDLARAQEEERTVDAEVKLDLESQVDEMASERDDLYRRISNLESEREYLKDAVRALESKQPKSLPDNGSDGTDDMEDDLI